ncbi:MAG: radical SAM protein [bacterium]|nr:radical SAM protein [bacterium]
MSLNTTTLPIELLQQRAREAWGLMQPCRLCPNDCLAHRHDGETGRCGIGKNVMVATAFPHKGEEECISGHKGSGTIFFSGCNLSCVFCQNMEISQRMQGTGIEPKTLAFQMLMLQDAGCHNLNLVSPTHVVPYILEALSLAVEQGFHMRVVYNTGGYDSIQTLMLLDGIVDVYMPDVKYSSPEAGEKYSGALDYPREAFEAIREMHRQVGDLQFDEDGLASRGLLVRHLILPNNLAGTREVMRFLANEISPATAVNLMGQYKPAGDAMKYAELNRQSSIEEILEARRIAEEEGLTRII